MNKPTVKQPLPHSSMHVWVMTFICALLVILAAAAATRLPIYLTNGDSMRLVGTVLFNLVALAGLANNVHTHVLVWQRKTQLAPTAAEIATQN